MYTSIATLCDHAADYNGKLVISGTFDSILTRQLPFGRPCMFALRLHCSPEDNGQQSLNIMVVDAAGTPMGEGLTLEFTVEVPAEMGVSSRNLVLNVPLGFEQTGESAIEVHSGGAVISRTPLVIVHVPEENQENAEEGEETLPPPPPPVE